MQRIFHRSMGKGDTIKRKKKRYRVSAALHALPCYALPCPAAYGSARWQGFPATCVVGSSSSD
jgi:hypothetical protein